MAENVIHCPPEFITTWVPGAAITKDTVVVSNAKGTVIKGAGANDANIIGVAQETKAATAVEIPVASVNGAIVWATAGAAVTLGAPVIVGDSSGRVIDCPDSAGTVYNVLGYARSACSNADEKVAVEICKHTRTIET